ncbi:MAG TPA: hypothetical protein P5050_03075 [Bacteroidia bacterium]|nr:hypothetical protein [Bacteroidia bacterium]HRS58181.1 hypothetical protein [Bacteroidia bacterium]HRU67511.1 hypothetical protein [Bacteroidia bacterium]
MKHIALCLFPIILFTTFTSCQSVKTFEKSGGIQLTCVLPDSSAETFKLTENIIRQRLSAIIKDKINIYNSSGKMVIQIPGLYQDDLERIKFLCCSQGKMDFWETYDINEIVPYLNQVNDTLYKLFLHHQLDIVKTGLQPEEITDSVARHLLFRFLYLPVIQREAGTEFRKGPCLGNALLSDTTVLNYLFKIPEISRLLPFDLQLLWTSYSKQYQEKEYIELIATKTNFSHRSLINENSVINVKTFESKWGGYGIEMEFNPEATEIWKRMTSNNTGKSIAIAIDGRVNTYPWVVQQITNGRSQISGNYTKEQADNFCIMLKNKALPKSLTVDQSEIIKR